MGEAKSDVSFAGNLNIIEGIARRLDGWQLFLFGCIFLIFSLCVITYLHRADPIALYLAIAILFLCTIIAALIVNSELKIRAEEIRIAKAENIQANLVTVNLDNKEFSFKLSAIRDCLARGLTIENQVFRGIMRESLSDFHIIAKTWAEHQIVVRGTDYNNTLINLYVTAKRSVFATSLPEYLSTWDSPFGEKILNAHEKSGAEVTRVFVYDKLSEITDSHYRTMERVYEFVSNHREKMSLYVWVGEWDDATEFPTILSRDFTVIDEGAAIGITESLGKDDLAARWYFEDGVYADKCNAFASRLQNGAKEFSVFARRWKSETGQP